MKAYPLFIVAMLSSVLSGCFTASESDHSSAPEAGTAQNIPTASKVNPVASGYSFGTVVDITDDTTINPVPYIPPQCYTDPVSDQGIQNPCYACHTESKRPNYLNDTDVQTAYNFPETGLKNNWDNLFKDRTEAIAKVSDQDILSYVREDNYFSDNGGIILSAKLANPPAEWDRNQNGQWDGYIPDAYFSFNAQGFDISPAGEYTGWRVFAYYPFLGTFMPTNGSTDDVMIRLPEAFRKNSDGQFDPVTYAVNLAIVEALIKEKDIPITAVDENTYGVDLDKNGVLSIAQHVKYDWMPKENRLMSYVGKAKALQEQGIVHLAARLYPEGTEFLHTVRYLDVADGKVKMAKRMKEVRYSKKNSWRNYYQLRGIVDDEIKERHDFPSRTKVALGDMESGLTVAQGWTYQGFIEDDAGQLRPQTYEETYFCTGCHGYIGSSNDTTISFARKFDHGSFRDGWYHWLEKGLEGIADPLREDGRGEYAYYLEHNPTGNEFRDNEEVLNKFFNSDRSPKVQEFSKLSQDISHLLLPGAERALMLNKAYQIVVKEQSYRLGRDAVIKPVTTVHKTVEAEQDTGIKDILSYY